MHNVVILPDLECSVSPTSTFHKSGAAGEWAWGWGRGVGWGTGSSLVLKQCLGPWAQVTKGAKHQELQRRLRERVSRGLRLWWQAHLICSFTLLPGPSSVTMHGVGSHRSQRELKLQENCPMLHRESSFCCEGWVLSQTSQTWRLGSGTMLPSPHVPRLCKFSKNISPPQVR